MGSFRLGEEMTLSLRKKMCEKLLPTRNALSSKREDNLPLSPKVRSLPSWLLFFFFFACLARGMGVREADRAAPAELFSRLTGLASG